MIGAFLRLALLAPPALAACGASTVPTVTLAPPAITVASVNGSGCPAGTATAAVNGVTVTVVYAAFTAKGGTGATPTEFRRNCQLNLQVVSPGQTYTVAAIDTAGTVTIPPGGTATQKTRLYLTGQSGPAPVVHTAPGPLAGPWEQTDPAPFAAPCGTTRNLNINTELQVATPGPAASLSLNGDGPGTTVTFTFTDCP